MALGNSATLDRFTNVVGGVSMVMRAVLDRFGGLNVKITVMGVLPRIGLDLEQVKILKDQNACLAKMVCNLVRRRQMPVEFLPAYKWLLKRIRDMSDGSMEIEPDMMYFQSDGSISFDGHVHLHLLLAKHLQLKSISYEWLGMPVLDKKHKHKVKLAKWPVSRQHGCVKYAGR